jgi:oligopeptide transport system permease protein
MSLFRKGAVMEKASEGMADQLEKALRDSLPDDLTPEQVAALDPSRFEMAEYDDTLAEKTGYSSYSYWRSTFRAFWNNRLARFLLVALLLLIAFTIIQPHLPGQRPPAQIYDFDDGSVMRNLPPSHDFWFGTNAVGQDLWARVWSGTRTSLLIALIVAISDNVIGITIGILWGYVRKLDAFLTEVYNIIDNIPRTIILILISYILRPGMATMIISMCCVGWLGMARFIRNQILMIRDRDYNLASRCLGTPTRRVITRNLLPQMVSVVMLRMALAIPDAIGSEVFLSYINLGLPISIPSLGNLINKGRTMMMAPSLRYQLFIPAIILSIITICFYLVGNAFSDAADPKNHV